MQRETEEREKQEGRVTEAKVYRREEYFRRWSRMLKELK